MADNKYNYTFRVIKNGIIAERYQTHAKRRFYNRIRRISWKKGIEKVYLRVSYGRGLDCNQKMTGFYNDGEYSSKKELMEALYAFSKAF